MTPRERYLATLRFEKPDRVPFDPGHGRQSTRARWHRDGVPAHVTDFVAYARQQLGIAPAPPARQVGPGVNFRMIPQFEEKVLGRRPGTLVVQDWKGNICEISDQFDVTYLRAAVDFVTRKWIKCPVESRADWEQMKRRYVVDDPRRFPADFADRARQLRDRTYPAGLVFPGPFWQLREWLGFENLCVLLVDDPGFAKEMIAFWEEFVAQVLMRTLDQFVPDFVMVQEDMACKGKPMIGPAMCREFLQPTWHRWGRLIRDAGVPIYEVDSDGYVGDLIPLWMEAGFNCNSPQEVAAGNDLPAYRRQHGTRMAYRGGVDKRAMAKGGAALRAEIDRLTPVIHAGGYIPSCDHGIPPDVSWPNFLEYGRLLAEATGWLNRSG
jgi:uroporphyrinogen decarboxylase